MNGYARFAPDDDNMDMLPLLETILKEIPAPDCEPNGPVALQICTVDHSSFVGRIGVGRLFSGTIHKNEQALVIKNDNTRYNTVIKDCLLYTSFHSPYQFVLLATRFNFPSTNPNSLFRFPYSHPFLLSLMFQSFLPSRGSSLIRFSIFRSPPSLSAFLQTVSRDTFGY